MQVPTSIDITGMILRIFAANGRIIAEIYTEDPAFELCVRNAITNQPITKGQANIYRGELLRIEKDEFLDVKNQRIVPRRKEEVIKEEVIKEDYENTLGKQ